MKESDEISIAAVVITPQIGFYSTKYTVYPSDVKSGLYFAKTIIKIHNRRSMQEVGKFAHNGHPDTGSFFNIF